MFDLNFKKKVCRLKIHLYYIIQLNVCLLPNLNLFTSYRMVQLIVKNQLKDMRSKLKQVATI
jgi:hypothetical protein